MQLFSFWKRRNPEKNQQILKTMLASIKRTGLQQGLSEAEIIHLIKSSIRASRCSKDPSIFSKLFLNCNFALFLMIAVTIAAATLGGKEFNFHRCIVETNYFVMEATRPITDCKICKDVQGFTILPKNISRDTFSRHAYQGHPLLVRGGCENWTALDVFSFDFFRQLYAKTEGAYSSVEEECQFFPFRTSFLSLREVFEMPESRAKMTSPDEKTWYIGWSNCNPDIASVLRKHYSKPHFLPAESELSAIDWIFLGYRGTGASMHLDYVRRPSWQAQLSGRKTWHLLPPPECEEVCRPMSVTVGRGDIVMVDTNQWYHTTVIEGDEMSVTLGSEYD